ncbi:MAG: hypothetical protein QXP53_00890 [Candidatus Pacearchaeota archaeon]
MSLEDVENMVPPELTFKDIQEIRNYYKKRIKYFLTKYINSYSLTKKKGTNKNFDNLLKTLVDYILFEVDSPPKFRD